MIRGLLWLLWRALRSLPHVLHVLFARLPLALFCVLGPWHKWGARGLARCVHCDSLIRACVRCRWPRAGDCTHTPYM